jgi:hypothetical protein
MPTLGVVMSELFSHSHAYGKRGQGAKSVESCLPDESPSGTLPWFSFSSFSQITGQAGHLNFAAASGTTKVMALGRLKAFDSGTRERAVKPIFAPRHRLHGGAVYAQPPGDRALRALFDSEQAANFGAQLRGNHVRPREERMAITHEGIMNVCTAYNRYRQCRQWLLSKLFPIYAILVLARGITPPLTEYC